MSGKDFTLVYIYYIPLIKRLVAVGYGEVILSRQAVADWWNRCISGPAIANMLAAAKKH